MSDLEAFCWIQSHKGLVVNIRNDKSVTLFIAEKLYVHNSNLLDAVIEAKKFLGE